MLLGPLGLLGFLPECQPAPAPGLLTLLALLALALGVLVLLALLSELLGL